MPFETCPPEIVESIVKLLPLHDICNLRLTNQSLASKATQKHFKANFHSRRVELSRRELRKFITATEFSGLESSLLRDLTLVAPVYSTIELEGRLRQKAIDTPVLADDGTFRKIESRDLGAEDLQRTEGNLHTLRQLRDEHSEFINRGEDFVLLSQAFANLFRHGVSLRSISAQVAVYRIDYSTPLQPLYGGGWKPIWSAAGDGVRSIFTSLTKSALCVEELHLFSSDQMLRCSLPCDTFSSIDFTSAAMRCCLQNLSTLSMRISDKIIDQSSRDPLDVDDNYSMTDMETYGTFRSMEEIVREASDERSFTGLSSMLHECHHLTSLEISHFELDFPTPEATRLQNDGILRAVLDAHLPCVRKLTLQGFFDTEEALFLSLLRSLPTLRILSLHCIRLNEGGRWRRILDYCTADAESEIEEMHLDTLLEPRFVLFQPPHVIIPPVVQGVPVECYIGSKAYFNRNMYGSDIHSSPQQRKIGYRLQSRPLRNLPLVFRRFQQNIQNRYGPPGYGAEACVRDVLLDPEDIWQVQM